MAMQAKAPPRTQSIEEWRAENDLPDWPEFMPGVIVSAAGETIPRWSERGRAIAARFHLVESTAHCDGARFWVIGHERTEPDGSWEIVVSTDKGKWTARKRAQ